MAGSICKKISAADEATGDEAGWSFQNDVDMKPPIPPFWFRVSLAQNDEAYLPFATAPFATCPVPEATYRSGLPTD